MIIIVTRMTSHGSLTSSAISSAVANMRRWVVLVRSRFIKRTGTEFSGRQGHCGASTVPGSWRDCDTDPRICWRRVKLIAGQTVNTSQPLSGLAIQLHDGDVHALADSVNRFFLGVTAGCRPLDDSSLSSVPHRRTLSQIYHRSGRCRSQMHKVPGPDGLLNWLLRDFSSHLSVMIGVELIGGLGCIWSETN